MKANEIYSIAKALMFEKKSSTIYDDYMVPVLNRVLSELFEENNNERIFNGKAPLSQRPIISSDQDEVPYEDLYVNEIIPIGMAMYFFIDDDLSKFNLFNTDYINARIRYQRLVSKEMIDAVISTTTI